MAQHNLPNGIPPQMAPYNKQMPQFNGIHATTTSRDLPPRSDPANQIRLPSSAAMPTSQQPSPIVQKLGQLNINNSPYFASSTPIQSPQQSHGVRNNVPGAPQPSHNFANSQRDSNSNGPFENIAFKGSPNVGQTLHQQQPTSLPPVPQQVRSGFQQQPQYQQQQQQQQQMLNNLQMRNSTQYVRGSSQQQQHQQQQQLNYATQSSGQSYPSYNSQNSPSQNNGLVDDRVLQQRLQPPQPPQPANPPQPLPPSAPTQQSKTSLHSHRYPVQQPLRPQQQQQQQTNLYPQQQQYGQQGNSVISSGFNTLWGQENFDLLQNPNVLSSSKVLPPQIHLGQEALDAANCSSDIIRCTLTKIPDNAGLLQKARLPLGVLIHPFKDMSFLTVIQSDTIVRCRACRTYINPYVFFVDTKRWKCNLCYRINELPEEFMYDPVSRMYGDPSRRPEIKTSTVEYIAPAEYMLRPPQPAVYLFLFDVSRLAVESGYLQTVCEVLLDELRNLPGDARTQLGIVCYDSALHFFSLGEGLSQPHEMTVLDIDDIFLPSPDNLLVNLHDRVDLLSDLLTQLPNRYRDSYDNNSALGAALQVAHKMMGATGGRVTVFQASLPNVGPGALVAREDVGQRATSEVVHLNPANDFYKRLALECSSQQIAVDLFVVNSQYVDIATISGISRFSGGCVHHYPLFKASKVLANERFERDLKRYLTRKIGFEAVMRIRCTRGLSIHTFHGNFFVRSTDLLSLPNISPDAGFGLQVAIDENLSDVQSVSFQAALLYTSSKGERRIRVHTVCLPTCSNLTDVVNSADQQCVVGLLAKMAVDRSVQSSLSDARDAFINVAIDILSSYKQAQNLGAATTALFVPQCLRLLPLYISALLKHTAFRVGSSTRLDDRVKAMIDMKTKPLFQLIQFIYPDLYPVHKLEEEQVIINSNEEPVPLPPHLQLTARCLDSKGAFLMDTGEHMIILVCAGVSQNFLSNTLGVVSYTSITEDMYEVPILNNPNNQRMHNFIQHLNEEKPFPATLHIIRDNSPHRIEFFERLIEDRVENALSYHEFLQHLKTQVK